jgi:hypothetical protein
MIRFGGGSRSFRNRPSRGGLAIAGRLYPPIAAARAAPPPHHQGGAAPLRNAAPTPAFGPNAIQTPNAIDRGSRHEEWPSQRRFCGHFAGCLGADNFDVAIFDWPLGCALTQDQHLTGQLEALKAAGAETIYREKISAARADRPQLAKLMASLKAGDVVLVTKLDRLGRSTRELLDLIEGIRKVGAAFWSLGDPLWDTSSSQGRLLSTLLAAIAECSALSLAADSIPALMKEGPTYAGPFVLLGSGGVTPA